MYLVKKCPYCHENNQKSWIYTSGYDVDADKQNRTICVTCGRNLINTALTVDEYSILEGITNEVSLFDAMDDLKQKDPIEFQLKMSQFKTQLQQQESSKQTNTTPTKDVIRCPKCSSTAITTGARGVNNFWGLLGASKTVNRCGNCGYTWKPNNW